MLSDTSVQGVGAAKGQERKSTLKGNQPMENGHHLQGLLWAVYSMILRLQFPFPTKLFGSERLRIIAHYVLQSTKCLKSLLGIQLFLIARLEKSSSFLKAPPFTEHGCCATWSWFPPQREPPTCTRARPSLIPAFRSAERAERASLCWTAGSPQLPAQTQHRQGARQPSLPVPPHHPSPWCPNVRSVCISVSEIRSSILFFPPFHIYALIHDREKSLKSLLKQIPSPVFMIIW